MHFSKSGGLSGPVPHLGPSKKPRIPGLYFILKHPKSHLNPVLFFSFIFFLVKFNPFLKIIPR